MPLIKDNMVPFTQYLLPDGRKQLIYIPMDDETVVKAQELLDDGYRFEAEILTTGQVSFTISGLDPMINEERDLDIKICSNGPEVPITVKSLIMDFDPSAYRDEKEG